MHGGLAQIEETTADAYLPQRETAETVAAEFDAAYQHQLVSAGGACSGRHAAPAAAHACMQAGGMQQQQQQFA